MNAEYAVHDTAKLLSPSLLFFKQLIQRNLQRCVEMAGGAERLRPHVKTHKTREIVRMQLALGITKQKCATIAEAEMVADCGAPDVLLSYTLVGPNCARLARLAQKYPACKFSTLVDSDTGLAGLADAFASVGQAASLPFQTAGWQPAPLDVLLDVDVGQHRTGIAPGSDAAALYAKIAKCPGLRPGGLHVYDGHNHQENLADREAAVKSQLAPVLQFREQLLQGGLPVPRLVLGGTPTFPVHVHTKLPGAEYSPGTFVLHDNGYGSRFADLTGFTPAALLLTRVISRPTPTRVTFDLGYKAVASDPPAGKRLILLDLPEYEAVLQNEEHLVIDTPHAGRFQPGDVAFAIPTHICPTCAMHRWAYVVEGGKVMGTWDIAARDRVLTV